MAAQSCEQISLDSRLWTGLDMQRSVCAEAYWRMESGRGDR